ncbi:MAG: riboflavin synthase [Tepidisphaera sp.]
MFTGIIRHLGRVQAIQPLAGASGTASGLLRLTVSPAEPAGLAFPVRPGAGDSIAVDGCCLTVVADPDASGVLGFDVVPETLRLTTLGGLMPGSLVHLEQAATASTLLDGHVVQGHIDGVAKVLSVQTTPEWRVRLAPPAELMPFIVPKGSVTLAGVSLTIAGIHHGSAGSGGWFEVALIPTTLAKTNLGSLRVGDGVNLECDAMAKTVVNFLKHYAAANHA